MYIDVVVIAAILTVLATIGVIGWFVLSFIKAGKHYDELEAAKSKKKPKAA